MAGWSPNIYVRVGDVEFWVYIAEYGLIGLDNSLEVDVDEEIVRVDVLFDETFNFQECGKKVPFILEIVRPVVAALSISQTLGESPFGNVVIVYTQLRIQVRCWVRDRIKIFDKLFAFFSLHIARIKGSSKIVNVVT